MITGFKWIHQELCTQIIMWKGITALEDVWRLQDWVRNWLIGVFALLLIGVNFFLFL